MQLAQNICAKPRPCNKPDNMGPTRQSCGRASDFHAVRKISRQCVARASETCLRKLTIFLYFQFNLCERINVCENSFTETLIFFYFSFPSFLFICLFVFILFLLFRFFFPFFSFNFYFNSFLFLFIPFYLFLFYLSSSFFFNAIDEEDRVALR